MSTVYLSGLRTPTIDRIAAHQKQDQAKAYLGLLVTPKTKEYLRTDVLKHYNGIGIDNGRFSEGGKSLYSWDEYERMIKIALAQREAGGLKSLYFVTAEDEPMDWQQTLALSIPSLRKIRALGAPGAIVLQNGLEGYANARPDNVPWRLVDAIFVGGDDDYKTGPDAEACVDYAVGHGIQVHMGRVNNHSRMKIAGDWGVHTADGTYLMFELTKAIAQLEKDNARKQGESDQRYNDRISAMLHSDGGFEELVSRQPEDWTAKNAWRERLKKIQDEVSRARGRRVSQEFIWELEKHDEIPRPFEDPDDDLIVWDRTADGVFVGVDDSGRVRVRNDHPFFRRSASPNWSVGPEALKKMKDYRRRGLLPR